jgi:hypothetical protein
MTYLVAKRFLQHDELVMMDNAVIHSQGKATVVEDMLWAHCISSCSLSPPAVQS